MKIGLLGSTCNPPHKEHIKIGEYAKKHLNLDRLIFVPTKAPPHKELPEVSPELRVEMARLAVDKRPGWEVSDVELSRKGKSYTRDTIKTFREKYPKAELFCIIGSDSFLSMPWKWRGGYGILDLCQFVVAPRPGHPIRHVSEKINSKVIILGKKKSRVSSSKIRSFLKKGKSVKKYLEPKVTEFIKNKKLYYGI